MFSILFIKIHLFFYTDYYFNYFRYIDLKKRIGVSFFSKYYKCIWISWLFEKFHFSTGIKHFWILWKEPNIIWTIYWIWSFDLDWNKIEAEKNLNHLSMLWTPPMGVQKLVSSRAYHRPMCGSGPSHGDIAWP